MTALRTKMQDLLYAKPTALVVNESSHAQIEYELQVLINALDNSRYVHFVTAVFDNYFIYRAESRNEGEQLTFWKQGYRVDKDEAVSLRGDPVQVRRVVEYVQKNNQSFNNGLHTMRPNPIKENHEMTFEDLKTLGAGAGDPLTMPEIDYTNSQDPIQRVRQHLVAKHGEVKANEKLRTMSGLAVLQLAEQLAAGKAPADDNDNSMPQMQW